MVVLTEARLDRDPSGYIERDSKLKSGELRDECLGKQQQALVSRRRQRRDPFENAVIDWQEANEELFRKLIDNEHFRGVVSAFLLKQIYERLVAEAAALQAETPAS